MKPLQKTTFSPASWDVVSYSLKEADVGSAVVLQTAGRSGSFNPHLHILCTSGGMTRDDRFKEFGFIDFDLLHTRWQHHLLKMLRENVKSKKSCHLGQLIFR